MSDRSSRDPKGSTGSVETVTEGLMTAEDLACLAPADLASLLEEMTPELRRRTFANLDNASAAAVLDELDSDLQQELLAQLSVARASGIVEEMPADEAADLLSDLPEHEASAILSAMDTGDAADVRELMDYESDTAGGQMTTEFIAIPETLTVAETIERLRELAPEAETVYHLFVIDAKDHLVGVVSLRTLILSEPDSRVSEVMSRDVVSVGAEADQEEAAELIARYNLVAVPVVDDDGRPIGIITVDDAVDVIGEETTEDLYELAGAMDEPEESEGALAAFQSRLPRLLVGITLSIALGLLLRLMSRFRDGLVGVEPAPRWLFIVSCLPVMLALSWLFESQARASLLARTTAGWDPDEIPWRSVTREAGFSTMIALLCVGLVTAVLHVFYPDRPGLGSVGLGLGCGLLVSTAASYLLGKAFLDRRPESAPLGAGLAAHAAGVLTYLTTAGLVFRS